MEITANATIINLAVVDTGLTASIGWLNIGLCVILNLEPYGMQLAGK